MDCEFLRPQQPWETTDGCIYLMRELAEGWPAQICALLPQLAHRRRTCVQEVDRVASDVGPKARSKAL